MIEKVIGQALIIQNIFLGLYRPRNLKNFYITDRPTHIPLTICLAIEQQIKFVSPYYTVIE